MENNLKIPHLIYYCWFGRKQKPKYVDINILSWKRYLPNYKIIEINEQNFDINSIPFCQAEYRNKNYAFVSDYARLKFLYENGGLYFDTDVELIKPISDILKAGPFMSCEFDPMSKEESKLPYDISIRVAPGLGCAFEKHNNIINEMKMEYENLSHNNSGTTIVNVATKTLTNHGLLNKKGIQKVDNITIYPKEYFNPKSLYNRKIDITKNTRSIHYYSMSWIKPWKRLLNKTLIYARNIFGDNFIARIGSKKLFKDFWIK